MPGTVSEFNPIREIIRPMFNPCSASGVALPTITSSTLFGSKLGTSAINFCTTRAPNSSARIFLKSPLGAFPTAVLYPLII